MAVKLSNDKFIKPEEVFLADVDVDYVPLHDMVRIFCGFYRHPTEKDYLNALEFIKYLMHKYKDRLKCLEGYEMEPVNMTNEAFIDWLKEMWYAGKYYQDIDYGVWFDLEEES
jgi:hypothetical protein